MKIIRTLGDIVDLWQDGIINTHSKSGLEEMFKQLHEELGRDESVLDFSLTPFVDLLLDDTARNVVIESPINDWSPELKQLRTDGRELFRMELKENSSQEIVILYFAPVPDYETRIETWLTYWVTEQSIQKQLAEAMHRELNKQNMN